jgi:protease I
MNAGFAPLEHLHAGLDQFPGLFRAGIRQWLEAPVPHAVVIDKEFLDLGQEMVLTASPVPPDGDLARGLESAGVRITSRSIAYAVEPPETRLEWALRWRAAEKPRSRRAFWPTSPSAPRSCPSNGERRMQIGSPIGTASSTGRLIQKMNEEHSIMANELSGKRIAVLATDGFEQAELSEPVKALRKAGAETDIIAPKAGQILGMRHIDKGDPVKVDRTLADARLETYAGLLLPGGVVNADSLRLDKTAIAFVRHFHESGKPIAAICHAPWALIEAEAVRGRTLTSWPSLQTDLKNAGARWGDREVAVDKGLVTSCRPDDLPAFCDKMIEEFREGRHEIARQAGRASRAG